MLNSISDIYQKAIFSVYTLQPHRRLEDFAAMKITTENDPQQLRNKKFNFIIIDDNNVPSQFVYNTILKHIKQSVSTFMI
jgi:hypothetical protein